METSERPEVPKGCLVATTEIIQAALGASLRTAGLYIGWNLAMPGMFGCAEISLLQAFAVVLIVRGLFASG